MISFSIFISFIVLLGYKLFISEKAQKQNDLENVAFVKYRKLFHLKNYIETLPNIYFARMTGSGSTIIGYFKRKKDALYGTKLLRKRYKNYWCIFTKTI